MSLVIFCCFKCYNYSICSFSIKKNLKKTMAGRAKTPTVLASSLSSSLTMGMPATSASSSMFSSSCSTLEHCLQSLSESRRRTRFVKYRTFYGQYCITRFGNSGRNFFTKSESLKLFMKIFLSRGY
jgi:hypothetical protein